MINNLKITDLTLDFKEIENHFKTTIYKNLINISDSNYVECYTLFRKTKTRCCGKILLIEDEFTNTLKIISPPEYKIHAWIIFWLSLSYSCDFEKDYRLITLNEKNAACITLYDYLTTAYRNIEFKIVYTDVENLYTASGMLFYPVTDDKPDDYYFNKELQRWQSEEKQKKNLKIIKN